MISLDANIRNTKTKGELSLLRNSGNVPAVIYGGEAQNETISVSKKILKSLIDKQNFLSNIVTLNVDGKPQNVLPREIKYHIISDEPIHVDFLRVVPGVKIRIEVPVQFINHEKSPGLKRGGVLNIVRRKVELRCPSEKIPESLVIDLDGIDIGESFKISSINLETDVTPTIKGRDFVIATLAAYYLAILFQPENNPHFLTAVMILAAQASSLASALALTVLSRGNQEIALIFTLLSSSFTVIMTPLILKLSLGANVEFPVANMILKMLQVVILPVALGQIIRRYIWAKSQPYINGIRIAPQIIILIFVYSGFSVATGQIKGDTEIAIRIVLISALLHIFLLAWNFFMSLLLRFDSATSTAVVFSGSQKTLPNGIYLWEKFFGENPIGALPLVIYHLIQLVVDTLLVPIFEKRNKTQ